MRMKSGWFHQSPQPGNGQAGYQRNDRGEQGDAHQEECISRHGRLPFRFRQQSIFKQFVYEALEVFVDDLNGCVVF